MHMDRNTWSPDPVYPPWSLIPPHQIPVKFTYRDFCITGVFENTKILVMTIRDYIKNL